MARRRANSPAQTQSVKRDLRDNESATKSQQVLALTSVLGKPIGDERELQKFRKQIEADREELKGLVLHRLQQAENDYENRNTEIKDLISQAFGPQGSRTKRSKEVPVYPGTVIATNPYHDEAREVLERTKKLVDDYDRMDKMIEDAGQIPNESFLRDWEEEVEKTERTLQLGRKVALRNVKKMLGADVQKEAGNIRKEHGDVALEDGELKYELLNSLRYAERGVKRMAKGLPQEDMEG